MRYYALVEDWPGESMVYFRELPGCFSSAPTYEEAVTAAPAAIAGYLSWLKKNDLSIIENVEDDGKIELVVKERLAAPDRQVGPTRSYHRDRKSTRLNSSHQIISYAVFCF